MRDLIVGKFVYTIAQDMQRRPTLILNISGVSGTATFDANIDIANFYDLTVSAEVELSDYWYAISYTVDSAAVPAGEAKLYPECRAASDSSQISLGTSGKGWGSSAVLQLADPYLQVAILACSCVC